jgi:predicted DNA-binding ribbon-helix-helix protein
MRTQLILESWQYDSLKSLAEKRDTSLSSVVREAVSEYLSLATSESASHLEDLRGIGRDTGTSGKDHDKHLYFRAATVPRRPRSRRARSKSSSR